MAKIILKSSSGQQTSVEADVFLGHTDWSTIDNKPSTFPPSSHDHSRILDTYNGNAITFSYGNAGIASPTWFAAWNNYELRAISPTNVRTVINAVNKAGDTMTGKLSLKEDSIGLEFRAINDYKTYTSYQTAGNEALVFATQYDHTSFMFINGEDFNNIASNRWQSLTPALQIKKNCVYINKLLNNNVNPDYRFYVNGSSYFNGPIQLGSAQQLSRNGASSVWVYGRNNALIRQDTVSGYSPFFSVKTTNGSWELGSYTEFNDDLVIAFVSDTNFNNGNNSASCYRLNTSGSFSGSCTYAASAGSAPASDVYSWAKASSKPSYTYSEVGAAASSHTHTAVNGITPEWAGSISSTSWLCGWSSDGSKIKAISPSNVSVGYATTAGSANAVTWANVSGKPSSFTPASHTHNSIIDAGDGRTLTFNYSGSGLESTAWLAGWNGNELRAISPSKLSVNYATSAGSASTATSATHAWARIDHSNELNFYNTGSTTFIDLYIGYRVNDSQSHTTINEYRFCNGRGPALAQLKYSHAVVDTTSYGGSLPSSGVTGQIFYKLI